MSTTQTPVLQAIDDDKNQYFRGECTMTYGKRTTPNMDGTYFVQDVASGYGPIEYTAKPNGPKVTDGYDQIDRDGSFRTIDTSGYDGPAIDWDEYFLDD